MTSLDEINWIRANAGASPEQIAEAEQDLGLRFPAALRAHYLKQQGGKARPSPMFRYIHPHYGAIEETLTSFYPLVHIRPNERSIREMLDGLGIDQQLPDGVVPIIESLGDCVCLDAREHPDAPSVVYFNHERTEVIPLAPTFDAFVEMLVPG